MTRFGAWPILALAGLASLAKSTTVYIPIYIPGQNQVWAAKAGSPYAVWTAHSSISPGTEVTVAKDDRVIDSAPLLPQALFAIDRDLKQGDRVWLPKDGLLARMVGGGGNWFCTWRFDDKAYETQEQVKAEKLGGFGYNLCLEVDPSGQSIRAKIMISDIKGLLAITDPESGMGRYRNGAEPTNTVQLRPVSSAMLPSWADLKITSSWSRTKGGRVCLQPELRRMTQPERCFEAVNQNVEVEGGRYTLTSLDQNGNYKIRIDSPINTELRPKAGRA